MKAPVLLIIFNRPNTTRVVFEAIKEAKPKKIYIAADGPRSDISDDIHLVEETREIVSRVDWPCEIYKKFEKKNLGCGPGPASGISWVFEHEDRAIILEDDCFPAQPFFTYCDELLEKYKDDERVWTISGNNFYEEINLPYSYIFSNYGHSWGWATWRRCWKHFDINMENLEEFLEIGGFNNVFLSQKEASYFNKKYQHFKKNKFNSEHIWDVQANFTVKSNRGLSIIPRYNLVKNIGSIGTHASGMHQYHNRDVNEHFNIKTHPLFVLPYKKYDIYNFKHHYYISKRLDKYIYRIIKKRIRKIFNG